MILTTVVSQLRGWEPDSCMVHEAVDLSSTIWCLKCGRFWKAAGPESMIEAWKDWFWCQ